MKPTLLVTTLSMILSASPTFAKSELETLRSRCAEQERQIRQLEDENSRLRSDSGEVKTPVRQTEPKSTIQPATAVPTGSSDATYTVKPGDSFEKIALKVGTSPEKLAKTNRLKTSAIIQPGQKLMIPGMSAPPKTPPAVVSTPPAQTENGKTHTIQQGETYGSISKKYRISTAALMTANPQVKATALRPGQVIRLGGPFPATSMISNPVPQTKAAPLERTPAPAAVAPPVPATRPPEVKQPAPVAASSPPETTPTPAPEAADSGPEKKFRAITIDGEMTYGDFAAQHGTDAERLNALNGLDLTNATVLAKGSELYVPAQP